MLLPHSLRDMNSTLYGRGRAGIVVADPAVTGKVSVGCCAVVAHRPTDSVTPAGRSSGSSGVTSRLDSRWVSRRVPPVSTSAFVGIGTAASCVSNHAVGVLVLMAWAASSVQTARRSFGLLIRPDPIVTRTL